MSSSNVGEDLDAWCNKCKLELAHVVVAKKSGYPVRVECKTCKNTHAYRTGPPGTKRGAIKRTPVKSDFDLAMDGRDLSDAQEYGIDKVFDKGDIIDHKTLGIGLVTGTIGLGKIDVLFTEGVKRMVHRR